MVFFIHAASGRRHKHELVKYRRHFGKRQYGEHNSLRVTSLSAFRSALPFSHLALFLSSNSPQQRGQPDHRRRRQPTSASCISQSLHNGPYLNLLSDSFFFLQAKRPTSSRPWAGRGSIAFSSFQPIIPRFRFGTLTTTMLTFKHALV